MRSLTFIFLCFVFAGFGQDKIFLKEGLIKEGVILSMGSDFIFYKATDTSSITFKIPRSTILMIEKYNGKVFIYASATMKKDSQIVVAQKRNSLGMQPLNVLTGRLTLCFERMNKLGTIGFCPVMSLSFNPYSSLFRALDTINNNFRVNNNGVNFIGGIDVNFYIGKREKAKFFIGPRLRYGIDKLLDNIEAYSVQTQFGWRFGRPQGRISQHLSFGLGFVRILSSPAGNRINPKQAYGWGSINYRIGVNW
ncbi:MAG: hypothetical protein H0W61_14875 [Bacteroidetes bacterium]|nr:hypothetical protein [Bacteroidota bacterium]